MSKQPSTSCVAFVAPSGIVSRRAVRVVNGLMENATLHKLLEACLVVARLGESDMHGWWATDGLLGADGAFVGPRVLPKTHPTARARIVFAVASYACMERHPDKSARSIFRLGAVTMDRLDAVLVDKLGDFDWWESWMTRLQAVNKATPFGEVLTGLEIVTSADLGKVAKAALGPDGRSLLLPSPRDAAGAIRLLAAGFSRSQPGQLAVPVLPADSELLG